MHQFRKDLNKKDFCAWRSCDSITCVALPKDEINYFRDLTPLLQSFSATLQQVKGEWQARLVTTFREAVEEPIPCSITFTIGTHGVENMPISSSDVKWRATLP